jgi:hypothetical protein
MALNLAHVFPLFLFLFLLKSPALLGDAVVAVSSFAANF